MSIEQQKRMQGRETVATVLLNLQPLLLPALIITIVTALIGLTGDQALESVGMSMLVNLVLVIGLYTIVGNSGIVSFGQMAFMGIGAYASAILSLPMTLKELLLPALPPWLMSTELDLLSATLISAVLCGFVALITGLVLMRMSGLAAGIASLALLLITQLVIVEAKEFTRGVGTMTGIPTDLTLWSGLAFALAALLVAFLYQRSSFGLRLRAVRDDELAAASLGVKITRQRVIAFVISGAICGVGGSMLAHYQGALNPSIGFFLDPTFLTLVMLVIGGMRSLSGAVVGVLVVSTISEVLRQFTEGVSVGSMILTTPAGLGGIVLGVALILILKFRPSGIVGNRELGFHSIRTARAERASADR